MEHQLNLQAAEPVTHAAAREAYRAGDGVAFVLCGHSVGGMLDLVFDNLAALKYRDIYETALVHAFTGCKTNNHCWNTDALHYLFRLGDRDRLRAAGEPLPSPGPFTAYRGVSGVGRNGRSAAWAGPLPWMSRANSRWRGFPTPRSTSPSCKPATSTATRTTATNRSSSRESSPASACLSRKPRSRPARPATARFSATSPCACSVRWESAERPTAVR